MNLRITNRKRINIWFTYVVIFLLILLLISCSPEDSSTKPSKDYVKNNTVIQCGSLNILHFYKDGFFFGEHKVRFIDVVPNFTKDGSYFLDFDFIYVFDIQDSSWDLPLEYRSHYVQWSSFQINRKSLEFYRWFEGQRKGRLGKKLGECILRDVDFFEKAMDTAEESYNRMIYHQKRINKL